MFNERLRRSILSASKVAEFFLLGKNQQDDRCSQLFYSTKGYARDFSDKIASFGNANIKYNFRSVVLRGKRALYCLSTALVFQYFI